MYKDFLKNDETGKYYLIEGEKIIPGFDGLSRSDTYYKMMNIGLVNERAVKRIGLETFIIVLDKILDGSIELGRFRFYRVCEKSESLKKQLKIQKIRTYGGFDNEAKD